jgi:competence protein ComEC
MQKDMKGKFWTISVWLSLTFLYILTVKSQNTVVFLDVGQGDAILIQSGSEQVLVDGGPDKEVIYLLPKYMPVYDRKIEYVVLTHPHADHIDGLLYVFERYDIGEIWYYPVCYPSKNYEFLLQNFDNIKKVGRGDTIRLKDIKIDVLWPILDNVTDICVSSYDGNINNDSIVLDFEYLGKEFLLMGDIENKVESVLISEGYVGVGYDILKAGHHCSKTSNSETFLKFTSPRMAICSAGEGNSFGHPSYETLTTFSSLNVQYLVTYEEGDIQIK